MPLILVEVKLYGTEDKVYTASVKPVIIKGFGPSGSLKKKNSILEQMNAVTAKISNEIFFDLKYKSAVLLPISIR